MSDTFKIRIRICNTNNKQNTLPYRFLLATPLASRMNIVSEFSVLRILSTFGLTAFRSESTHRSISSAERQLKYRVLVGEVTCRSRVVCECGKEAQEIMGKENWGLEKMRGENETGKMGQDKMEQEKK